MTTSEASGRFKAGILAVTLCASAGAARAADDLGPAIEAAADAGARPDPWQVAAGGRSSLLRGAGFDPFSTNDAFAQFSATALRSFATGPRLVTAAGLLWETGTSVAVARGADAELGLRRVGLVLEERFAPRPWGFVFGRVAASWLHGRATLADPSAPARLESTFDTLGVDASAGVAGRLNARSSGVGFWVLGDAGYGWARAQSLVLTPALGAADRDKAGATTLSDLAPRGPFMRLGVALTF